MVFKIKIHNKNGIVEKSFTDEEAQAIANRGNIKAKKYLLKKSLSNVQSVQEKLNLLLDYLGLN